MESKESRVKKEIGQIWSNAMHDWVCSRLWQQDEKRCSYKPIIYLSQIKDTVQTPRFLCILGSQKCYPEALWLIADAQFSLILPLSKLSRFWTRQIGWARTLQRCGRQSLTSCRSTQSLLYPLHLNICRKQAGYKNNPRADVTLIWA